MHEKIYHFDLNSCNERKYMTVCSNMSQLLNRIFFISIVDITPMHENIYFKSNSCNMKKM